MKQIILTEDQLNRLVESSKTVFKDEDKMKESVEMEMSEDKKCKCKCNKDGEDCKCPPDCKECDCSKEKETKEDWNPNESMGTQPGSLNQGAHFPKWIQENKLESVTNDFKRFL